MNKNNFSKNHALVVDNVSVTYGSHIAVNQISFTCFPGSITAILGTNGAGKTSLVEAIEGYRKVSSGSFSILGLDPQKDSNLLKQRVGVMLQQGGVSTGIRVIEVLRLYASYYDNPLSPEEILFRVGLEKLRKSYWRTLSGGEKQRLCLALALIGQPELVFLDEPTAGVDPVGKLVIRKIIEDLRSDGVTVVLTSHDLADVEKLADTILILQNGSLVASGTPEELTRQSEETLTFKTSSAFDMETCEKELSIQLTQLDSETYLVHAKQSPKLFAEITLWFSQQEIMLDDLRITRRQLEDVFLQYAREDTTQTNASDEVGTSSSISRRSLAADSGSSRRRNRTRN